jgi:PhnB protein
MVYTRAMRVTQLLPKLVVADATRAIAFYREVFGATEVSCHRSDAGKVIHAELSMDGVSFYLKDADQYDQAPVAGGTAPVILSLDTDDSDALYRTAIDHGAEVIYPLETRPYGARDARIRDPFGHVWIIATRVDAGR